MASRKIKDLVATIGEYTNKDGEVKKRYFTLGHIYETDDGSRWGTFKQLPLGTEWSGTFGVYDAKEWNQDSPKTNATAIDAGPSAQRNIEQVGLRQDDDVPF